MAARSVAVYGAGAVGCYLGGKLTLIPDLDVTLIGRPRVVDAIQQHGLAIVEGKSREMSHPHAVRLSAEVPACDLVLLTVRTYDVGASIPHLRALLGENGVVATFQNGVGTEEMVAEALGRSRVLACTLTVSEGMEEPGVVTRYSRSGGIALATMDGSPVPTWVVDLFRGTRLPTVTLQDYRSLRWSKLLLNMLAAPTSSILDMDIDRIMANPELFRLEQLAFREAGRVMDAMGIRTVNLPGYPVRGARLAMRLPRALAQRILAPRITRARGGRSPGMRVYMQRGKTEVGDFNGAIARAAGKVGVSAPVNEALAALTQDLAANAGRRAAFRGNPAALLRYVDGYEQSPS